MNARAVCALLGGIHRNTLANWIREGLFPPPLMTGRGRHYVWRAQDVEAALRRGLGR
jgi:predicted DNA-binding transcriptional regulator AlpA